MLNRLSRRLRLPEPMPLTIYQTPPQKTRFFCLIRRLRQRPKPLEWAYDPHLDLGTTVCKTPPNPGRVITLDSEGGRGRGF